MSIRPGLLQLMNITLPDRLFKLHKHAFSRGSTGSLIPATICNSCSSTKQLLMGQNKSCKLKRPKIFHLTKRKPKRDPVSSVSHQNQYLQ